MQEALTAAAELPLQTEPPLALVFAALLTACSRQPADQVVLITARALSVLSTLVQLGSLFLADDASRYWQAFAYIKPFDKRPYVGVIRDTTLL